MTGGGAARGPSALAMEPAPRREASGPCRRRPGPTVSGGDRARPAAQREGARSLLLPRSHVQLSALGEKAGHAEGVKT